MRLAPLTLATWSIFLIGALNSLSPRFDQLAPWTAGPMLLLTSIGAVAVYLFTSNKKHSATIWLAATAIIGWLAEVIGVNSGLLFGEYTYSTRLGPAIFQTPILIGSAWVLVALLASSAASLFSSNKILRTLLTPAIMTAFDAVMEPAAVRMGLWIWSNGEIPILNYVGWYLIGLMVVFCGEVLNATTDRPHTFFVHLLFAQLIFFFVVGWV